MRKKKRKEKSEEDFPSEKASVIPDFLPPPSELAKWKTKVVITMALDAETLEFFKKEAKKRGGKYQKMIREVLKRYADHYNKAA